MENHRLKNLKDSTYERISFVFRNKPLKNPVLRAAHAWVNKNIDLKKQQFMYVDVDFLIISANPLLSVLFSKNMYDLGLNSVFVHNLYMQDGFDYDKCLDQRFLDNIMDSFKINRVSVEKFIVPLEYDLYGVDTEKVHGLKVLEQTINRLKNNQHYYTTQKSTALTSLGEKFNDYWFFNTMYHAYSTAEKNFSFSYASIWSKYERSLNSSNKLWNFAKKSLDHDKADKTDPHYMVFAKKIIVLQDNNPYIKENLYNPNDNTIFIFNPKDHMDDFDKKFKSFILEK